MTGPPSSIRSSSAAHANIVPTEVLASASAIQPACATVIVTT
jgi:hypothetical protein